MAGQEIPSQLPTATQALVVSSQPTKKNASQPCKLKDSLRKSSHNVKSSALKPPNPANEKQQRKQKLVHYTQRDALEEWDELTSKPWTGWSKRDLDPPKGPNVTMEWAPHPSEWTKMKPIVPLGHLGNETDDDEVEDEDGEDDEQARQEGFIDLTQRQEGEEMEVDDSSPSTRANLIDQAKQLRTVSASPEGSPIPWPASDAAAPQAEEAVEEQESDFEMEHRSSGLPSDSNNEDEARPEPTDWLNGTSPAKITNEPARTQNSSLDRFRVIRAIDIVAAPGPPRSDLGKKDEVVEIESGDEESSSSSGSMSQVLAQSRGVLDAAISDTDLPDDEGELKRMLRAERANSPLKALIIRKLQAMITRDSAIEEASRSMTPEARQSDVEVVPGTFEDQAYNSDVEQYTINAIQAKRIESQFTSPPSMLRSEPTSSVQQYSSSATQGAKAKSHKVSTATYGHLDPDPTPIQVPQSNSTRNSSKADASGEAPPTKLSHQKRKPAVIDAQRPTPKRPKTAWKVQFESSPYEMSQSLAKYADSPAELGQQRQQHKENFSTTTAAQQDGRQPSTVSRQGNRDEALFASEDAAEIAVEQEGNDGSYVESRPPIYAFAKTATPTVQSRASVPRPLATAKDRLLTGAALSLFQHFQDTYPSWKGSEKDFILRCEGLGKATIMRGLYDDYVIQNSTTYREYVLECANIGEGSRAYTEWFVDEVEAAHYTARVLNREVVTNFLTSIRNTETASITNTPQVASQTDPVQNKENHGLSNQAQVSIAKANLDKSPPEAKSMVPVTTPSSKALAKEAATRSLQTSTPSQVVTTKQATALRRRTLPWSSGGNSNEPIEIDDENSGTTKQSTKQSVNVAASAAKTATPTSTKPVSTPKSTPSAAPGGSGVRSSGLIKPLPKKLIIPNHAQPENVFEKIRRNRKSAGG